MLLLGSGACQLPAGLVLGIVPPSQGCLSLKLHAFWSPPLHAHHLYTSQVLQVPSLGALIPRPVGSFRGPTITCTWEPTKLEELRLKGCISVLFFLTVLHYGKKQKQNQNHTVNTRSVTRSLRRERKGTRTLTIAKPTPSTYENTK